MMLRENNAVISLLTTVLLIFHAIFNAVSMLSMGAIKNPAYFLSFVLLGLMFVHAVMSIMLLRRPHKGAEERKTNGYAKLNASTIIQRISGVLLVLFTVPHILGAVGVINPSKVVHAILPPLFFTVALAHVAVSTSKAFITLGVGDAKFIKNVDVIVKVLCIVIYIADVAGFFLYLW